MTHVASYSDMTNYKSVAPRLRQQCQQHIKMSGIKNSHF